MLFYKQTTKYTNAACALMLAMNHFKKDFPINKEMEYRIWRQTVILPTRASCIYSLAMLAKNNGIKVRVGVGDPEYRFPVSRFKIFSKKEIYESKFSSNIFYREAKEAGIKIEERDFTLNEVKENLIKNKVLLLRINMGPLIKTRSVPDYALIYGYGNEIFLWNNCHIGDIVRIKEKEMKECFETVKTKCKRDNRMLILG